MHVPRLTSDVQLNAMDAGVILRLREQHGFHEVRELTDSTQGLHEVARAGATLSWLDVRDCAIGVEDVASRRLNRRPSCKLKYSLIDVALGSRVACVEITPPDRICSVEGVVIERGVSADLLGNVDGTPLETIDSPRAVPGS